MAKPNDKSKQDNKSKQNNAQNEHDPLFNLKHAQAESELAENTNGLGPVTNVYVSREEREEIESGIAPRDSQGFRRGVNETDAIGSNAGDHN